MRIGVLGLAVLLATPAAAWGPLAHRVIARVAARHLSPAARHEVGQLLAGASLADVAYWADEIREQHPETARWHYVDIPLRANDYRPGDLWCGVYTSMDGGRTWLEQLVPRNGSLSLAYISGDPSVAFDGDGNAYVTCIGQAM